MTKHRDLAYGQPFPVAWPDALEEFISTQITPNFVLENVGGTSLRIQAGVGNDQVGCGIMGKWRYNTATVNQAHPAGGPGVYDVFVIAAANVFTPTGSTPPEVDNTVYAFALKIMPTGQTPSGTGSEAVYRKVATTQWSGSAITRLTRIVPPRTDSVLELSDGVTGTGLVVLQTSPSMLGVPAAPTAAADTNTTQIATTAFVLGQVGTLSPIMDGAAVVGTSYRYARQDHVHPTDTSRAPLLNAGLTGVPSAPTAAPDTNTSQIATTGFVIGQVGTASPGMDGAATVGVSLRYSRQDHIHPTDTSRAPLASPGLTGTPSAPTAGVGTNTTQVATTQFVQTALLSVPNSQGGSYTLAAADAFKTVEMSSAGALTLTVPTNASVAFPIGTIINVVQSGSGQLNVAAAGGVTLYSYNNNLRLAGPYAVAALIKRTTDTWWLAGNLVP